MAVGNTFGATALSSYGGFWISFAILLIPDLDFFAKNTPYPGTQIDSVLGFWLMGWFIFTFILLLCTLRSTVAFFSLFLTLDIAFLMLSCQYFAAGNGHATASVNLQKAGGLFGLLAAFLAWYCALAGIMDDRCVFKSKCRVFRENRPTRPLPVPSVRPIRGFFFLLTFCFSSQQQLLFQSSSHSLPLV